MPSPDLLMAGGSFWGARMIAGVGSEGVLLLERLAEITYVGKSKRKLKITLRRVEKNLTLN